MSSQECWPGRGGRLGQAGRWTPPSGEEGGGMKSYLVARSICCTYLHNKHSLGAVISCQAVHARRQARLRSRSRSRSRSWNRNRSNRHTPTCSSVILTTSEETSLVPGATGLTVPWVHGESTNHDMRNIRKICSTRGTPVVWGCRPPRQQLSEEWLEVEGPGVHGTR